MERSDGKTFAIKTLRKRAGEPEGEKYDALVEREIRINKFIQALNDPDKKRIVSLVQCDFLISLIGFYLSQLAEIRRGLRV